MYFCTTFMQMFLTVAGFTSFRVVLTRRSWFTLSPWPTTASFFLLYEFFTMAQTRSIGLY